MPEYENRTRRELDAALRKLLRRRPLNQLRIRELTELCGLRRQSFYYHFKDIYELFDWSMGRERELLLRRQEECLTWQQALLDLLLRAEEEQTFYRAVLDYGGLTALGEMIPLEEMLKTVQAYYRDRNGRLPNPEAEAMERRCGRTVLLSLVETWARGEPPLQPEEIVASLERTAEQSAAGAMWQTLRERGEWNWTP